MTISEFDRKFKEFLFSSLEEADEKEIALIDEITSGDHGYFMSLSIKLLEYQLKFQKLDKTIFRLLEQRQKQRESKNDPQKPA